jgi:hypothetical protein
MPPTEAMGSITQNRRDRPTVKPLIDVVVLGCSPLRMGEGAAAPFIGVHILGKIRPAGGFDTLAESQWEDQIGPSIVVKNQPSGASLCLANRPWDGTAALFVATEIRGNIRRLGGVEGMANW